MLRIVVVAILLVAMPVVAGSASCGEEFTIVVEGTGSAGCHGEEVPGWVDWAFWASGVSATAALGAWAWLGWLRWLPIMGGFTRLRKDTLLEHPRRNDLFDLIQERPGIHHSALATATGMGQGQLTHHLAALVRAGLIQAVRRRKYTTYFLPGAMDAPVMHGLSMIKSQTGAQTLSSLALAPGTGPRPLAKRVGCSEGTIRHHVRRLRAAGLVDDGLQLTKVGEAVQAMLPEPWAAPRVPPGVV